MWQSAGSWSPRGEEFAFVQVDPVSASDVWVLPLEPDRPGASANRVRSRAAAGRHGRTTVVSCSVYRHYLHIALPLFDVHPDHVAVTFEHEIDAGIIQAQIAHLHPLE